MSLLHWFLPQYCTLCTQFKPQQYGLCSLCLQDLTKVSTTRCQICALPAVNNFDQLDQICGHCQSHNPAYDTIITPYYYQQPASSLITSFKFHNQTQLAKPLSEMIYDQLMLHYIDNAQPQLILPVPLHYRRRYDRGFNQAILLAHCLSRRLKIPLSRHALKRINHTQPQRSLPQKLRQKNVRRAFALGQLPAVKHIALLDDVVTTGATVHELSKLLKASGIERVDVWCCARTLKEHSRETIGSF